MEKNKTRTPFGQRLFDARKKAGLSQKAVRDKTGMAQSTLSELENDAHGSTYVAALAVLYNESAIYLAEGKRLNKNYSNNDDAIDLVDNADYPAIKRVNLKLSAGISGFSIDYDIEDKTPIVMRKEWFDARGYKPAKLLAVEVRGESMQNGLFDGDTVVINTADTTPIDGEVFAINYEGEMLIKRMVRDAGTWWLSSDNQDQRKFPRKECSGDACLVVGRIVHKQSERI